MKEFEIQGEREKKLGLAVSPNMGPCSEEQQREIQITFIQIIVQPLFESFHELFPKTGMLLDLIIENLSQWGGQYQPSSPHKPAKSPKKGYVSSPMKTGRTQRLSSAAGIIDIPESMAHLRKNVISHGSLMSESPVAEESMKSDELGEIMDSMKLNKTQ